MTGVKKKAAKKKTLVEVTGATALAVREFTYAHREGHTIKDLEALQIYIRDLYGTDLPLEGLHALVEQAKVEIKADAVNADMESILFSTDRPIPRIKLGAAFCQNCARFKNYRKECPFCGHHEMLV